MVDVGMLRTAATARALQRPPVSFAGRIDDGWAHGTAVRRYRPDAGTDGPLVIFLHGGYGIFGDLDLQDGLCRRLADGLGRQVVAVEYPLTPEHTFVEAVDTVAKVTQALGPVVMAGDSAGGALAVATARRLGGACVGLFLTNPNLDLTLGSLDPTRPGGPDPDLLRFAMTAWHRPAPLTDAPRLHQDVTGLPPTVIAVGTNDSLAPECHALANAYRRCGTRHLLLSLPGANHGFMGDPDLAIQVIDEGRSWGSGLEE